MPAGKRPAQRGMKIYLKACHCEERSDAAISFLAKEAKTAGTNGNYSALHRKDV